MEFAIQTIWWIGLIGAAVATAILLKLIFLLLNELSQLARLAAIARDASRGIAANAEQFSAFGDLANSSRRLSEAAKRQAAPITSIEAQSKRWREA